MTDVTRKDALTRIMRDPSQGRREERAIPSRKWLLTCWVLFGCCLLGLVAAATSFAIFNARERVLSSNERELQNLAFVLAARANGVFQSVGTVERDLVARIEYTLRTTDGDARALSSGEVQTLFADRQVGLP
jgi:hypothetical protein